MSQWSRKAACPAPDRHREDRPGARPAEHRHRLAGGKRTRVRLLSAATLAVLLVTVAACGAVPTAQTWPGLTVDGETLYAITGAPQQVVLLDAAVGNQKTVFRPSGEYRGVLWWSPVLVPDDPAAEGLAFVGFADQQSKVYRLYAFDAETGQEQWSVPADDLILPAPVYDDGAIYFGSSDGHVYAVDLETRNLKPGWPFQAREAIWGSPLADAGRVYVPSMDHHLYCLDAETGELLWEFEAAGALAVQPVLDAETGILYVGSFDGHLYAVHSDSGEAVDGFDFAADDWIWSEALVTDEAVLVTALDGKLYALDPATGAVVPPYPYDAGELGGQEERIRTAPVLAGDNIVVTTESGKVIAVQNGQRQWYWPSGTPEAAVLTTPQVGADLVYVLLMNGRVQALNIETGVQAWSFAPPQAQ